MGIFILLNDVHTHLDKEGLLYDNAGFDELGKRQSISIADYINKNINVPDEIICSDAANLQLLIHKIRMGSSNKLLTENRVHQHKSLKERSFGVLTATKIPLDNDIFTHSRILPEHGESVSQCRERLLNYIKDYCSHRLDKTILCISHTFSCQILSNVLLQKSHCLLSKFWQNKGSGIVLSFEQGTYGIRWKYVKGFNGVDCREYSEEEIHRPIFEG